MKKNDKSWGDIILEFIGIAAIIVVAVVGGSYILDNYFSYSATVAMRNSIRLDAMEALCSRHNSVFDDASWSKYCSYQCVSVINDTIIRKCIGSGNMNDETFDHVYFTGEVSGWGEYDP